MPNRFFVVAILVVALVPSTAAAGLGGGLIAGSGVAGFAADDVDLQDAASAGYTYSVGLQGRAEFGDVTAIRPELLFTRKRTHIRGRALGYDFDHTYSLSYLEIPVLFRVELPLADVIAPKLFFGPHASIFLDGRWEGAAPEPLVDRVDSPDIDSEDVRNFQVGMTAGVGMDVNFKFAVVTTDLRYVGNFTGVFENVDPGERVQHGAWLLMIGATL